MYVHVHVCVHVHVYEYTWYLGLCIDLCTSDNQQLDSVQMSPCTGFYKRGVTNIILYVITEMKLLSYYDRLKLKSLHACIQYSTYMHEQLI